MPIDLCVIDDYIKCEDFLKDIGLSHSFIKENISKGLRQKKLMAKSVLSLPDYILNHGEISSNYTGPEMKILYQDDEFLVIDKKYNIHSHPLKYNQYDNCLSFIRAIGYGKYLLVNNKRYDRGLLYRLDHTTSGVLFYCKNFNLYKRLREHYDDVIDKKIYLAIVSGEFKKNGIYDNYFKPTLKKGKKMKIIKDSAIKGSLSVELLSYNANYNLSLLKIELFSGVRHQIRAQLSHISYPILGDKLYSGDDGKRLFLHAYRYCLKYGGKIVDVKSDNLDLFENYFNKIEI